MAGQELVEPSGQLFSNAACVGSGGGGLSLEEACTGTGHQRGRPAGATTPAYLVYPLERRDAYAEDLVMVTCTRIEFVLVHLAATPKHGRHTACGTKPRP